MRICFFTICFFIFETIFISIARGRTLSFSFFIYNVNLYTGEHKKYMEWKWNIRKSNRFKLL